MHYEDITPGDFERFWSKVDTSAGINGCWPRQGYHQQGYAGFSFRQCSIAGSRFAFVSIFGDPPPHLPYVLHKCPGGAHRWCNNPAHLAPGTQQENMVDMLREGGAWFQQHPERIIRGDRHGSRAHPERRATGSRSGRTTHPESFPCGSAIANAKLTEAQVREIRHRAPTESASALAREYQVSRRLIRMIVARAAWKHVA